MSFLRWELLKKKFMSTDYESIKSFHKLCSYVYVVPHWNLAEITFNRYLKIKFAATLIFMVFLFAFNVFGKINVLAKNIYCLPNKVFVLDHMFYGTQTLENVLTIVINTVRWKELRQFARSIEEIDRQLEEMDVANEKKLIFVLEVVFCNFLFFISCFIYDPKIIMYAFPKQIQIYNTTLGILLMSKYLMCLKARLEKLNLLLAKVVKDHFIESSPEGKFGNSFLVRKMKKITKLYLCFLDLIEIFNLTFQWQILFIAVRIACESVMFFTVCLNVIKEGRFSFYFAFIAVARTSQVWILTHMLARSANKLVKEIEKLHRLCRKLLTDMRSTKSNCRYRRILQDQVFLLSYCYDVAAPKVTAAGFFTIDHSFIIRIVGYVLYYLMVLIQM